MKIHSDCSIAAAIVDNIVDTLLASGAQIPPNLVAVIHQGNMHLEYSGEIDKSCPPQFLLPETCLVPLPDDLSFLGYEDNQITILSRPVGLADLHYKLLENILKLYNSLGKVKSFAACSFWSSSGCQSSTWLPFYALRSQSPIISSNRSGLNKTEQMASSKDLQYFLNSRVLGWTMTGDVQSKRVLIPIIDMANHHDDGAAFIKASEDDLRPASLSFEIRRCTDSEEVFACYGTKDSLDLFLNYSYPDTSSRILRSCPLSIDISSMLHLSIGCTSPQLGAPITYREPGFVRISSLMWDVESLPGSLLLPIAKISSVVGPEHFDDPSDVRRCCTNMARLIIDSNITAYSRAVDTLRQHANAESLQCSDTHDHSQANPVFIEQALSVLEHQLSLFAESRTYFDAEQL